MGFKYDWDVFAGLNGRRTVVDSTKVKNFTKGFDVAGRTGIAWAGSVQCYVFRIEIEGKLDPEWVAKQLGKDGATEKSTKKKRKKKKETDAPCAIFGRSTRGALYRNIVRAPAGEFNA